MVKMAEKNRKNINTIGNPKSGSELSNKSKSGMFNAIVT
jgi:hypothetical protein